jgi:hypothetical protein
MAMDARNVMWFSLVGVGYMLTFFIPVSAILGFSLGVFFAALAYPYIRFQGLGLYYLMWLPLKGVDLWFLTWSMTAAGVGNLIGIYGTNLSVVSSHVWGLGRPSFQQVTLISEALKVHTLLSSSWVFWSFQLFFFIFALVQPIIWFYASRKLLKKLKIYKRIGLLKT